MRRSVATLALLLASACGRFSFEPRDLPADATTADTAGPAPDGDVQLDCANHQGALFCDGFEDPSLAAWQLAGDVMRALRPTPRGAAALQADTTGPQQTSGAGVGFGPIGSGLLAARGWFYVPSGFDVIHFDLLILKNAAIGGIGVLGYFGELVIYQNVSGEGLFSGLTVPRDRWMCIELQVQVANAGSAQLLLDGVPIASTPTLDLAPGVGYSFLDVGLAWTDDTQGPARVFADEIVIDDEPIGCD